MKAGYALTSGLCLFFSLCLTACEAEMSLSYKMDTGDAVKVTLDVEKGSCLVPDEDGFAVGRDGQTLLSGRFNHFEEYFDYVLSFDDLEVYEITPEDDTPSYYFFEVNKKEGDQLIFLTQVEDSPIGAVLCATGISVEEAEDAFLHLHFTILQ